ncbi:MAG: LysR family transcriptional regulator [Cyanobacteria bacterium P01_A01_bin.135]
MNISHLSVLAAIAKHGSFSTAAIHLDLSQSAVSRAIATLEDDLGVLLLVRGRFGARLTPVGERVLTHARKILQLQERIESEVNSHKGLNGGHLRIASFRSAATHLLPPVIAQFCQRFPGVDISLDELDPLGVERALREGGADIGLLPLPRSEEFETWEVVRDEFVVLLPEQVQTPETLSWEYLAQHDFILYNYAECTSAVRRHWAQWDQTLNVAYEIKEDSTIVSMVAQGLGAAILPRLAALPIPDGVQVRSLPVPLVRVVGAAIAANSLQPPATFVFLELLRGDALF